MTPRNASSGPRQADAGLIPAGHHVLPATLTELAHRLRVHVLTWPALRRCLRAAGKAPCVIVAAVANRWVRRWRYEVRTPSGVAEVAA